MSHNEEKENTWEVITNITDCNDPLIDSQNQTSLQKEKPKCKANKNHNNNDNDCKTSLLFFLLPFDLHTYNDTLGFN